MSSKEAISSSDSIIKEFIKKSWSIKFSSVLAAEKKENKKVISKDTMYIYI